MSPRPIREVVTPLSRLLDSSVEPRFGALPDRPSQAARAADAAATQARLGWRPTISLEEGLRRTVAWHRQRALNNKKGGVEP